MGKKGYNWKSRAAANVDVDNSTTKEIVLDIQHRAEDYDSCNALVLPAQKRKTKNIDKKVATTRLLSKKRRKQLEKIIERKKKKLQRAALLEDLTKVQATPAELKQYVSLTSMQNKGLKRHFRELETPVEKLKRKVDDEEESDSTKIIINSIKMSKKKRLAILNNIKQDEIKLDPNVVGFESSDSSNEDDSDNEEDNEEHVANNIASDVVPNKGNKIIEKEEEKNLSKEVDKETTSIKSQESKQSVEVQQQDVTKIHTPAVFIPVNRKPEIQAVRLKLPVVAEEQVIVETINENPIVIITGETGSGKTTQVPQFLYEAGYAQNKLIGITEPRRVAAMSMSKRVAEELNLSEKLISYLIRFEGNVTEETKIKFMTDGVLMKEVQSDFLLTKYSVIILDEAHERSVYSDILIGLLSRIVPLRNKRGNPLKLIIMSATLSVKEFVENTRLFKIKPPIIEVKARQFPVKIHFNRTTSKDYVNEALQKTIKIHTRLPEGGILIFLTGQQEVHTVVRKLRKLFPLKKNKQSQVKMVEDPEKNKVPEASDKEHSEKDDSDDDFDAEEALRRNKQRQKKQIILPTINLDDYSINPTDDTHEDLINVQDDEDNLDEDEDEDEDVIDFRGLTNAQPLWVLPLYSLLPGHKQAKVFEPPPEGYRLCVVSTNVAETSLTIPNIRYVVDSGRCKTRLYDKVTGVSTYHIGYTSKAAAAQRAGRAGRTRPGHCYRLYSSAVYNNDFEEYSQSEIQRKPVDDLLLQMKAMNIDKVVNFPFPTPPDIMQLKSAENRLTILEALQPPSKKKEEIYCTKVTPLGRSIAAFPVSPRYGKMLALSHQHNLSKYTICMVAALSVQEVLIETLDMEGPTKSKWLQKRRYWAGTGNSLLLGDLMVLLRAIGTAEYAGSKGRLLFFCEENGLRHKAVIEIRKLRQQLTNEINLNIPNLNLIIDPKMPLPTDMQAKLLRQIVLAGMADQVAKKVLPDEIKEDQDKAKWKHAYRTPEMEEPVFMHSSCALRKTSPEWVVYQEVYETNKMYMRGVTAIEPEWLPKFVPMLCRISEPLVDPPPRYNPETGKIICRVSGTFGKAGWVLPLMDIEHPLTVDGVKWFAYFFLEGQVFSKLKRFVPSLLTTPGSITKSWAKLIPRTQVIVQTLQSQGIMSKDKLIEIWVSDKKFLLSAYQKWLPESAYAEVAQLWPPL
ncbi:PREDICTED: probable ATP-dependent RNA helicase kurz [Cyphomyrmex costatus]|uniref:RNA helicase n=1 Tax=Cyphomyrmex costatus TaxID=456900 RepID=A0A195CKR7_9HYME|nr:PREDICTED: probable ATP-dependent RNA helicase kurz [Cyphomyrmex costatus]XP_018396975.1 PREDICTED: probable ATP-dependent RNA helicase kurz [Cyphomyrmex costatus]XP_018396976.1 PREDICTED: probable ATP-dependent RNA helicase kurz [Cyphomyrmex costatus]XP_018396977.1 PREDICTED: probable ATP-dependent RNA helicase kurz [Cyphomyrmex costatus]KYN01320.1 putative ATP-dependent RNA helicase kurz [Cyphomyrmex costatus]